MLFTSVAGLGVELLHFLKYLIVKLWWQPRAICKIFTGIREVRWGLFSVQSQTNEARGFRNVLTNREHELADQFGKKMQLQRVNLTVRWWRWWGCHSIIARTVASKSPVFLFRCCGVRSYRTRGRKRVSMWSIFLHQPNWSLFSVYFVLPEKSIHL